MELEYTKGMALSQGGLRSWRSRAESWNRCSDEGGASQGGRHDIHRYVMVALPILVVLRFSLMEELDEWWIVAVVDGGRGRGGGLKLCIYIAPEQDQNTVGMSYNVSNLDTAILVGATTTLLHKTWHCLELKAGWLSLLLLVGSWFSLSAC